ncbi:MAG: hypothetical protein ABJA60_04415 [Nitrosospira sp.]
MRFTLLAVTVAALTMTACSKPNQALPEQEKKNYEKITSRPAVPAAPAVDESSGSVSSGTGPSSTVDTVKTK